VKCELSFRFRGQRDLIRLALCAIHLPQRGRKKETLRFSTGEAGAPQA
jgi:hypothetical protein